MASPRRLMIEILGDAKGFTKSTKEAEQAAGGLGDKLNKGLSKNVDDLQKKFPAAGNAAEKFGLDLGSGMGMAQGAMVAAAGAAIAFGKQSVTAFQDAALTAGKFAESTGMAVDESSRWMAVVKPLGVELGDMQDVFGNLSQKIVENDKVLGDLGVTIAHGKDGRVDMNETVTRIVESLGKVVDPAKRAAMASALFGEQGARQFAPLVAHAAELREQLEAVSDAKVIDEKELKKAEELRDASRELNGRFEDLKLTIGSALVPALVDLADGFLDVLDAAEKLNRFEFLGSFGEKVNEATGGLTGLIGTAIDSVVPFDNWSSGVTRMGDSSKGLASQFAGAAETIFGAVPLVGDAVQDLNKNFDDQKESVEGVTKADRDAAEAYVDMYLEQITAKRTTYDLSKETDRLARSAEDSAKWADEQKAAYDRLLGRLDSREAIIQTKQEFDALGFTAAEALAAAADGAADAQVKSEQYALANLALQRSVATYADELGKLPTEKITQINALIDAGDVQRAEDIFTILTRNRSMNIDLNIKGAPGYHGRVNLDNGGGFVQFQEGGLVPGSKNAPMLAVVHGGEYVLNATTVDAIRSGSTVGDVGSVGASSGGTAVVVNVYGSVTTEQGLVDAIHRGLIEKKRSGVDLQLTGIGR